MPEEQITTFADVPPSGLFMYRNSIYYKNSVLMKAGPVKFDYKGMQNNKHVAVIIHKDPNAVLHFEVGNILWPMDIAAVTRLEAVSPMAVKKI